MEGKELKFFPLLLNLKMMKNIILILALFLTLSSCEEMIQSVVESALEPPEPEYPEITTEGRETFAFKALGKEFITRRSEITSTRGINALSFSGRDLLNGFKGSLGINLSNKLDSAITIGNYNYPQDTITTKFDLGFVYFEEDSNNGPLIFANEEDLISAKIEFLRADYDSLIFSATFEMVFFDPVSQDTVKITEGRFDIPGFDA